jgi:hypothetical protein
MITRICSVSFVLGLAVFLAACSTMSAEECQLAQWRDVGQRDGLRGEPLSLLSERNEDCAKVGVVMDHHAYQQGRALGLSNFCRIENAVPLGLSGAAYAGVCPPAVDGPFQQRYQVAHGVFVLRRELKSLDDRSESLERRLRDVNHHEDQRLREANSDAERGRIRKELDEERYKIRGDLAATDRSLHRKREELRSAEFDLNNLR